jgi:hypothetical protein
MISTRARRSSRTAVDRNAVFLFTGSTQRIATSGKRDRRDQRRKAAARAHIHD